MKRIRDIRVSKALEVAVNKKIEYLLQSDFATIDNLNIENLFDGEVTPLKDVGDLYVLQELKQGVNIKFSAIDLNNITLKFSNTPASIVFERCKLNGTKVVVEQESIPYELSIEECEFSSINIDGNFGNISKLKLYALEKFKVDNRYTLEQIANKVEAVHPEYNQFSAENKIRLMRQEGYIRMFPSEVSVLGIQEMSKLRDIEIGKVYIKEDIIFNMLSTKAFCRYDNVMLHKCRIEDTKSKVVCRTKRLELKEIYDSIENLLKYFSEVESLQICDMKQEINLTALPKPKKVEHFKVGNTTIKTSQLKKYKNIKLLELENMTLDSLKFLLHMKRIEKIVLTKVKFQDDGVINQIKNQGKIELVIND